MNNCLGRQFRLCLLASVILVLAGAIKIYGKAQDTQPLLPFAQPSLNAPFQINISNICPKQGETIQISVFAPQSDSAQNIASLKFNGKEVPLFEVVAPEHELAQKLDRTSSFAKIGLLAIPADLRPGRYHIENIGRPITVVDARFPIQHLSLPPSKDNFDMAPGEKKAIEQAKGTVSNTRFWTGPFSRPSGSRISAGFGLKRVVNGKLLKDYYHSGLDFRAPMGSSVHACAAGKVILAKTGFKLHGNTISIDHGQGVVSFYIHLKQLFVTAGDHVAQGQLIGEVGQTGRASGPHLHFSLYVNQVATNPITWFKHAF